MLLKQKFKTHDGAHKRALFENAHRRPGTSWRYAVVRFRDGVRDGGLNLYGSKSGAYHWQIERV